ncbi:Rha family transcriptional regulator [Anaerococcus sp. Marseille-P3915]|uniref:Rha family transcriptional regulator n=1 Tax=Anaerococcus sp. Marseille-P3915 TaxID=2057799 RepID=UPI000D0BB919|nr:Rha family transcriptional regulator [Anaerococcus sp. Marseille-P3915]
MNGLVQVKNDKDYGLITTSRIVAEGLDKRHDHVLRDLERILETPNVGSLIIPTTYKVKGQKREYKEYLLTKDGFTLYMFNIQGYNDFKMAYINEFNRMERLLNGEQLELEAYKLEKKTYKGKPVMTVRDIVYLTGQTRDSLNWAIKRDGLGLLLQGRSLEDFREENSFVLGATRRLNILFNEDVYELTKNQNIPGEKRNRINEYFNNPSLPREEKSIKVKDVEILQKVEKLNTLYFLIQRFGIDEKMKGDITEIISERYVELGFLDHKCRDLSVHTLEGWNLGCKFQNFKMMIINN